MRSRLPQSDCKCFRWGGGDSRLLCRPPLSSIKSRLDELSRLLTNLGSVGDNYAHVFEGLDVPTDNAAAPGLDPYRGLQAGRPKLGSSDPTPSLSDELYMAYVEPLSLLCDSPALGPTRSPAPRAFRGAAHAPAHQDFELL